NTPGTTGSPDIPGTTGAPDPGSTGVTDPKPTETSPVQTNPTTQTDPTNPTKPGGSTPSPVIKLNATSKNLKAGQTFRLTVSGTSAKPKFSVKSGKSYIKLTSKGKVTALKKGTAVASVKVAGKTLTCKIKVTTSPKIKIKGKAFKKSKTYTVAKGKTLSVSLISKASALKNSYKSSKSSIAKVKGTIKAKNIKIKGLKPGKATITIKVNKTAVFKIKVRVK
ncbi:MAG: hypothetical protein J1E41_05685, partial [Ruminococcus sp.]|nr:hypothetical protein [Ruminococcus sp.]